MIAKGFFKRIQPFFKSGKHTTLSCDPEHGNALKGTRIEQYKR